MQVDHAGTLIVSRSIFHCELKSLLFILSSELTHFGGPDPVSDGYARIVDDQGRVGYADAQGTVKIKPQFAYGFPFEEGIARVTKTGKLVEVSGSDGEYHRWESDDWFCIDKTGAVVDRCSLESVR